MTIPWQNGGTVVSRLRVSGSAIDPLATRLRIASLLSIADLRPAGLAPSAIVCVRRLQDPQPGLLSLRSQEVSPPQAWSRAVIAALEQLISRAVRPIREAVPGNAECVIFADRAEMVACLAIDWCEGRVGMRWWWRSLLPGLDGSRSILTCWLEAPEYILGAWAHLANRGKAAEFAGRMSADEARDMMRAVTQSFALDDLQAVVDATPSGPVGRIEARDSFRTLQSKAGPTSAPWNFWAPESDRITLGIEQRCLLGVALTLHRAPTVARTRSFAHAAHRWLEAAKNDSRREQAATLRETFDQSLATAGASEYEPSRSERRAESRRIEVSFMDAKSDEGRAQRTIEGPGDRTALSDFEEQLRDSETFNSDFSMNEPEGLSVVSRVSTSFAVSRASTSVSDDRDRAPEDKLNAEPLPQPAPPCEPRSETPPEYRETAPLLEAQINTNFGGLFYLLNFGLYLELYGDITTPLVRDIPLGVWDFLALVGERLVGSELRDDPVWALLARLAGSDETWAPGDDCVMPESWRMPAQWMKPFESDGVWRWETNEDGLRVWHPAGFLALDLPLEPGDSARQLRREMEAFGQFAPMIGKFRKKSKTDRRSIHRGGAENAEVSQSGKRKSSTSSLSALPPRSPRLCGEHNYHSEEARRSLRHWLDWLMPYARARLRLALGLAETGDVGRALCECRARVFVTATHMDVMFSLAELLVEIRLAGLDRDPGWIPATGRIIRFHFE